uniref:Uncharacterized protein n=1 Tax=Glossina pallidipes TaxID=7398 RepID=A0A1B0AIY6_GLOPL
MLIFLLLWPLEIDYNNKANSHQIVKCCAKELAPFVRALLLPTPAPRSCGILEGESMSATFSPVLSCTSSRVGVSATKGPLGGQPGVNVAAEFNILLVESSSNTSSSFAVSLSSPFALPLP